MEVVLGMIAGCSALTNSGLHNKCKQISRILKTIGQCYFSVVCLSSLIGQCLITMNFQPNTNAIYLKQFGFMSDDFTTYQLTHLYHKLSHLNHIFSEALVKEKYFCVVFCDISKAFDRVQHKCLVAKLVHITDKLLVFRESYLSDWTKHVVINGLSEKLMFLKALFWIITFSYKNQ